MSRLEQRRDPRAVIATLLQQERPLHPRPTYLHPSPTHRITPMHREGVVEYVHQLAEDFGLQVQTGGLACNYFDRYLGTMLQRGSACQRSTLPMLAAVCLLLAAKFLDRKLPPLSELEAALHGAATAQQLAGLELQVLDVLGWELHVPLPHAFCAPLCALVADAPFGGSVAEHAHFLIDLSVFDYALLAYTPAEVAAGALLTAWRLTDAAAVAVRALPPLARGCDAPEARLAGCADGMMRRFRACVPEAPASCARADPSVNAPTVEKEDPATARASSPDCVLALGLG